MPVTSKRYRVIHPKTGLYVRKNVNYGGFRWVKEYGRATTWKTVGQVKNSAIQGALRGERGLMVEESQIEEHVVGHGDLDAMMKKEK